MKEKWRKSSQTNQQSISWILKTRKIKAQKKRKIFLESKKNRNDFLFTFFR